MSLVRRHLAAAIALCTLAIAGPLRAQQPARTLVTEFTYTATAPALDSADRAARELNLWIPLPSDGPFQTVRDIRVESSAPYRITRERRYGNRMVYVRIPDPTGPTRVTVRFRVERREIRLLPPNRAAAADPAVAGAPHTPAAALFLEPDRRVPTGGKYGELARQVAGTGDTPLAKMHALFDHVVATMQYDYKKESPEYAQGDVAFVCDYKKGNCSDLHSYLVSLARSLGIPAYIEYGFPVTGIPLADPLPREGTVGGYHCWAWFRDPERGWLPLDASDARRWQDFQRPENRDLLFGNLILERNAVAVSRGRDITLAPPQKAAPLNDFIYPYAEADGRPLKVGWEVRYALR